MNTIDKSRSFSFRPHRSASGTRLGLLAAAPTAAILGSGATAPALAQVGIGTPSTQPVKEHTRPLGPAFGQREFESNCASCHGMSGRGGGPLAGFLSKSPPDLTQLAKTTQGCSRSRNSTR